LDDHYTAKQHKHERLELILELQKIAAEFSVRITILGGDVHLAACGRFYSHPQLGIPVINDHRYIANIISSAIVNKPPPPVSKSNLRKNEGLLLTWHNRLLQTSWLEETRFITWTKIPMRHYSTSLTKILAMR
jgi:PhoD related phosphatase